MRRFFLYFCTIIFSLCVFLFVGLFLILSFSDLNDYREDIISLASDSLGKDVRVYGDFDLHLSLQPSLRLSDIEVRDPDLSDEPIIVADSFYIEASLWSLFGRPVIENFILHNAEIYLHKKAKQNEYDDKTHKAGGGGGDFLSDFPIFNSVDVKNVVIHVLNPEAKINFQVPIETISIAENKVNINIADMTNNGKSYGNFLATAHVDKDSIIVDSLKQGDAISGEFAYFRKSNIRGDIQINGFPIKLLDILTGNQLELTGKLDGSINLHATAKDKKDLMESLTGNIQLQSYGFIIRKDLPYLSALNFSNLNIVTSGCLLLQAPIRNGIATIKGASALNIGDILSNGTINFATEAVGITNHIYISLPIITVSGDVNITGDLTNPKIEASDFSDLSIDGAGILEGIVRSPEQVLEQLEGFFGDRESLGRDCELLISTIR